MKRRVFYSFHYTADSWRASMVRNIGSIEGNKPATDNAWEATKKGGEAAIRRWIADEMKNRSCTIVLVGSETSSRHWITYEIVKSWNDGMGVVGIDIHGLKAFDGSTASIGANPFANVTVGSSGKSLSSIVKLYDPGGRTSKERYEWISTNLASAVEEAIDIRQGS